MKFSLSYNQPFFPLTKNITLFTGCNRLTLQHSFFHFAATHLGCVGHIQDNSLHHWHFPDNYNVFPAHRFNPFASNPPKYGPAVGDRILVHSHSLHKAWIGVFADQLAHGHKLVLYTLPYWEEQIINPQEKETQS